MLSSTKLAISKWTPRVGEEVTSTSARRESREARSPKGKEYLQLEAAALSSQQNVFQFISSYLTETESCPSFVNRPRPEGLDENL